ncbi:hypothetical protein POPTR_011G153350v4 [Populus trichocarpa]|uniref:Uncharacterized protein n=1 Tax=Populus trichocarpa TaxID=3694 RepID=A0ACC0SBF3_POPTR|nr:hypothetical protein BDE02_11G133400 [Populus trichocarpa]KAI9386106.1 hypothetical protein POPTR_011G153350v4 [Populus trichocarpa]
MHESVEIYVKGFDAPTPPIQRDGILISSSSQGVHLL